MLTDILMRKKHNWRDRRLVVPMCQSDRGEQHVIDN